MIATQTVEIPPSHRLTIDVPPEVPVGTVVITFTPAQEPQSEPPKRVFGCLKGQIWMADDFDAPSEPPLAERVFGCAKGEFWMADDFDAPLDDFKDYM